MKRGFWMVKFAAFGALMVVLFGWATFLLWNWLVPVLFAGPVITFWQALGLLLLTKILFWGIGKSGPHRGGHWRHQYWRKKWDGMTEDEKVAFKNKMKDKWCYKAPVTPTQDSGTANV